jgi:hypothetical protein
MLVNRRRLDVTVAAALAACGAFIGTATPASAQPFTPAEQAFLNETYQYAHPSLTDARLVELGHQACTYRRSGQSSEDARNNLVMALMNQGILSTNAEVGSLVHDAVDTLCPEVGYP